METLPTVNCRLSATVGTEQMLEDNIELIERGGEWLDIDSQKSVPIVLMADSENGEIEVADNREN